MYPANSHVIRPATADDAVILRRIAFLDGREPLTGRVYVAEVYGAVAAAISRDDRRTIADRTIAPAHLTTLLRLRVDGLDAFERQPQLSERVREAVLGRRPAADLPMAA